MMIRRKRRESANSARAICVAAGAIKSRRNPSSVVAIILVVNIIIRP